MFDISWSEIAIVLVLAIIFINPKDLPEIMRVAGKFIGRIKRMGKEFISCFEKAAGEEHIREFRDQLEKEQQIIGRLADMEGNPREVYDVNELEDASRRKKDD